MFERVKLRYLLPTVVLGYALPYLAASMGTVFEPATAGVTSDLVVLEIAAQTMIFVVLWTWCRDTPLAEVFGEIPGREDSRALVLLGIPMVGTGAFCFYLVFYPLSFVAPEFVQWWAIELPELLVPLERDGALTINLGTVLLLVGFAPVVEELLFRGFIYGRLKAKLGVVAAIVVSSLLFAVFHPDVLGAFVFAVFMCLIRTRYDSLVAPLLVHMGNNAVVVILGALDLFVLGSEYQYTIQEFRSYWWVATMGALIGVPWLIRFYRAELVYQLGTDPN